VAGLGTQCTHCPPQTAEAVTTIYIVITTLRAALDSNVQSGDFYGPDGFMEMRGHPVKVKSNKLSHDNTIAQKLWQISEELTQVEYSLN